MIAEAEDLNVPARWSVLRGYISEILRGLKGCRSVFLVEGMYALQELVPNPDHIYTLPFSITTE